MKKNKLSKEEMAKRDAIIVELALKGETCLAIANKFNITKQRSQQILDKYGVKPIQIKRSIRKAKTDAFENAPPVNISKIEPIPSLV